MDELNIQVQEIKSERSKEAISKNHYFDNKTVEQLVVKYVNGGCVDISLRDDIMSHASELIKQVIKTHKLNVIYKGRDGSAFSELFQVAYCQIESTLYKFNLSPGHKKIFNMWSQVARTVILAYIKKENKDVKSNNSYKDHKTTVQKAKPDFFRLFDEAKIIFKNEPKYLKIIEAINHLYLNDETPHDGMIYKLVSLTGFSKKEISEFLISVKANSGRFSDSPENLQSKIHRPDRVNYIVDEEDG